MIEKAEFASLTPNISSIQRDLILPPLQEAMAAGKINTKKREAHFMAQVLHESGRFRYKEEIASGAAYEGRRDLGNTHPGDGRKFKGRGWIQVTGRHNYAKYGKLIGVDLISKPALAATYENAAKIAVLYWTTHGLNELADGDKFLTITRRINGGTNGLSDRRALLSLCNKVLDADPLDNGDAPVGDAADPEAPTNLFFRGKELPFDGFLRDGTSYGPLRALSLTLGFEILEAEGADATIKLADGRKLNPPLEIRGKTGWSPIKQLGYHVEWNPVTHSVEIS